MTITKMSWRPQYRSSKFRHVFGKPANKENCYDGVPITKSVHDSHFCSINPRFIAVVTECAGGGAFLIIPIHQTGKIDPHHPRVCGHRGNVLDIKWNPFDDYSIASGSEDSTVKIWDIPKHGMMKNITTAKKELQGHSRRVGLIEWHPTAGNVLFSAGYDYKIMVWNLDTPDQIIKNPVKTISVHSDVVLSMSFNTDGSLLATSCKDKKLKVIDSLTGVVLQEANCKSHKANKVVFLGNLKKLVSTGTSRWNNRQIALWDQDDLSVPLLEEDLDGSSGVPFPFYDPDTHMLYVAGKGDGNIRYYEISSEKPYLQFLAEYRSYLPQKGIGIMPKRGLDVSSCEVFRFYKLVTTRSVIEPLSMIVPRRSESYQEDIYPMTAGSEPAMTAEEWFKGVHKGPILMSLKPGSKNSQSIPLVTAREPLSILEPKRFQNCFEQLEVAAIQERLEQKETKEQKRLEDKIQSKSRDKTRSSFSNGCDLSECAPPKTENELLQMFYRQQEEIRQLKELLGQRDVRVKQLELEIKNIRNYPRATERKGSKS
ncbi:coronin-2A-like isoform X3 [Polyodon spathula]|uniref:coronin-2A-like isoform X3 n=1 Tax=Polyodon spathula TaxID=7913 RepID=UPI001B7E3556|nr:coronin-2A-like isoform X3 [Polyodon spathula]